MHETTGGGGATGGAAAMLVAVSAAAGAVVYLVLIALWFCGAKTFVAFGLTAAEEVVDQLTAALKQQLGPADVLFAFSPSEIGAVVMA